MPGYWHWRQHCCCLCCSCGECFSLASGKLSSLLSMVGIQAVASLLLVNAFLLSVIVTGCGWHQSWGIIAAWAAHVVSAVRPRSGDCRCDWLCVTSELRHHGCLCCSLGDCLPLGLSIIMGYGRHQDWCIRAAYAACVVFLPLWLLGNWRHDRMLLARRVAWGQGHLLIMLGKHVHLWLGDTGAFVAGSAAFK